MVEELRQCYNDADLEETAVSLPRGLEQAYVLNVILSPDLESDFILVMDAFLTVSWAMETLHIPAQ